MSQAQTPPKPERGNYVALKEVKTVQQALMHPETRERFLAASPKWCNAERMQRICLTAIMSNPALQRAPMWTLVRSCLSLAGLGLEPNSPLGHGYLIPFGQGDKAKVEVVIGYKGYILLAHNSGIRKIRGDVVYEGDLFEYEYGTQQYLRHRVTGQRNRRPINAYGMFGDEFEVRDYRDVLQIRDATQGYRYALSQRDKPGRRYIYDTTPWVAHEHAMAAKTMVRSALRWAPMSPEMAIASEMDSRGEAGHSQDLREINSGFDISFMDGLPEDPEDGTGHVVVTTARGASDAASGTVSTAAGARTAGPDQKSSPGQQGGHNAGDRAGDGQAGESGAGDQPTQVLLYFFGADGEPAMDGAAYRVWTASEAWAHMFLAEVGGASDDARPALIEHNADGIEDACADPSLPGQLRDELRALTQTAGGGGHTDFFVPKPAETGKPAGAAYVAALSDAIRRCKSDDDVAAFREVNKVGLLTVNASGRRVLEATLKAVRAAWSANHQQDGGDGTADADAERMESMVAAIWKTVEDGTKADFESLINGTVHKAVMSRLRRERPDLAEVYDDAVARAGEDFSGMQT